MLKYKTWAAGLNATHHLPPAANRSLSSHCVSCHLLNVTHLYFSGRKQLRERDISYSIYSYMKTILVCIRNLACVSLSENSDLCVAGRLVYIKPLTSVFQVLYILKKNVALHSHSESLSTRVPFRLSGSLAYNRRSMEATVSVCDAQYYYHSVRNTIFYLSRSKMTDRTARILPRTMRAPIEPNMDKRTKLTKIGIRPFWASLWLNQSQRTCRFSTPYWSTPYLQYVLDSLTT